MSVSMINIDLLVDDTIAVLRTMPDVGFHDIPGGISVALHEGGVAYVGDAAPESGTDINVKDRSDAIGWLIYRHLVENTPDDVVVWMMDDGAAFVAGRGITAEQLGI